MSLFNIDRTYPGVKGRRSKKKLKYELYRRPCNPRLATYHSQNMGYTLRRSQFRWATLAVAEASIYG